MFPIGKATSLVKKGIYKMPTSIPVYIQTFKKGLLAKKIEAAYEILKSCTLCPRKCKVNRLNGETGVCKTGEKGDTSTPVDPDG